MCFLRVEVMGGGWMTSYQRRVMGLLIAMAGWDSAADSWSVGEEQIAEASESWTSEIDLSGRTRRTTDGGFSISWFDSGVMV